MNNKNVIIVLVIVFLLMGCKCSCSGKSMIDFFLNEDKCFNLCTPPNGSAADCPDNCKKHGALKCTNTGGKSMHKYNKCKCVQLLNTSQGIANSTNCEKSKPGQGFGAGNYSPTSMSSQPTYGGSQAAFSYAPRTTTYSTPQTYQTSAPSCNCCHLCPQQVTTQNYVQTTSPQQTYGGSTGWVKDTSNQSAVACMAAGGSYETCRR